VLVNGTKISNELSKTNLDRIRKMILLVKMVKEMQRMPKIQKIYSILMNGKQFRKEKDPMVMR